MTATTRSPGAWRARPRHAGRSVHRIVFVTRKGGAGKTMTSATVQAKSEPALAELPDTLSDHYLARPSLQTPFADLATIPEIDDVVGLHGLERLVGYLVPTG
jgi:hypothetical protein